MLTIKQNGSCEDIGAIQSVEQTKTGEIFELFGSAYKRQDKFQDGDKVLFIEKNIRMPLDSDRRLKLDNDGNMVTEEFSRLVTGRVANGGVDIVYHADRSGQSYIAIKDISGTYNTPGEYPYFKPVGVTCLSTAEEAIELSGHLTRGECYLTIEIREAYRRTHIGEREDLIQFGQLTAVYMAGRIAGIRAERVKRARKAGLH